MAIPECCDPLADLAGDNFPLPTGSTGSGAVGGIVNGGDGNEGVYDPSTACGANYRPVIKLDLMVPTTVTLQTLNLGGALFGTPVPKIRVLLPAGLVSLSDAPTMELRVRDHYNLTPRFVIPVTNNGVDDLWVAQVPALNASGLFVADFVIFTGDPKVARFVFPVMVQVANNSMDSATAAPLTIAELRMFIRDACKENNRLIDDLEYTDAEITGAMRLVVDYFNEIPPGIGWFTYAGFPFRMKWLEGTVAMLMRSATQSRLRNYLPAQGGGLTIDDSLWQMYAKVGEQYWSEYTAWARAKKMQINAGRAFRMTVGATTFPR